LKKMLCRSARKGKMPELILSLGRTKREYVRVKKRRARNDTSSIHLNLHVNEVRGEGHETGNGAHISKYSMSRRWRKKGGQQWVGEEDGRTPHLSNAITTDSRY